MTLYTPPTGGGTTKPTHPPDALDADELKQAWEAAAHAQRRWPGPIGELISRDIREYATFGYRVNQDGLIPRVIHAIMAQQ